MAYTNSPAPRLTDGAGSTLPLLAYLAIATVLMVADLRGGFATQARQKLSVLAEPVWWLAASPNRLFDAAREQLATRASLQAENEQLRRELQVNASRLHRLLAVNEENQRLRELLGGTRGYRLNAQLAGIIDVDLDPSRQRIVLDAGSLQGVQVGQAMIDAGGVLGQVIEVTPRHSTALLLTDTEHAIPVQVARSGLRAIAYGTGRTDRLRLPSIPQSGDIRVGDRLVTSGIGGRFPAGFPVGLVESLQPDETQLFVVAEARPAALLDRGVEVLLVSNVIDGLDDGPPLPEPPPASDEGAANEAAPSDPSAASNEAQAADNDAHPADRTATDVASDGDTNTAAETSNAEDTRQ